MHQTKLHIALIAPLLSKRAAGLSSYVADLVPRVCDAGHHVTVVTTDCGYRGVQEGDPIELDPRVRVIVFRVRGKVNRRFYRSPELASWFSDHVNEFDVVDIQGFWTWIVADVGRACLRSKVPYVITPHGMMTHWDFSKRKLAKWVLFHGLLRKYWRSASAVRFLSEGERVSSFTECFARYSVIPNAINVPSGEGQAERFLRKHGLNHGTPVVAFIGRITEQKGVREIVEGFEIVSRDHPSAVLAIGGPLEGSYAVEIQQRVSWLPSGRVLLLGPVFGADKIDLLAAASVFITLSRNEGLPIAALEALSYGVPVVLTPESNLPEIAAARAGIVTKLNPSEAARAISSILEDSALQKAMSSRARILSQEQFGWDSVLPKLTNLYVSSLG